MTTATTTTDVWLGLGYTRLIRLVWMENHSLLLSLTTSLTHFSQQNCKSASTNTTSSVTKITAGAAICAAFLAGADASHAS